MLLGRALVWCGVMRPVVRRAELKSSVVAQRKGVESIALASSCESGGIVASWHVLNRSRVVYGRGVKRDDAMRYDAER